MTKRPSRFHDLQWQVGAPYEFESYTPDGRRERPNSGKPGYGPDDEDRTSTDAIAVVECRVPAEGGDKDNEWWVRLGVAPTSDGSYVVRSLAIEPTGTITPPDGITTGMLRDIHPPAAIALVAATDFGAETIDAALIRSALAWLDEHGPILEPTRRRGRPRLPDDLLARVALAYLEEIRGGRGVLKRLSERFDNRPEDTMRDWVRIARTRGWLSAATKQGSRSGSPGPLLIDYINKQEKA